MTLQSTLHGSLLSASEKFSGRLAVADAKRSLSYRELAGEVLAGARALQLRGLEPGGRVMICLPNSVAFVVAHFAVLAAGGVSVPCEPRAPVRSLAEIARRSEAAVAVFSADVADACAADAAFAAVDILRVVPAGLPSGDRDFALMIQANLGASVDLSLRGGSDIAAVLFTTGSTGRPKGVVLTHQQTLFTIGNLIKFFRYGPEDREVITIPVSHSFGLGHVYCNLFSGGAVRLEPGLISLKRVFDAVKTFGATGFPGTPLGFGLMMDRAAPVLQEACKGLRFIVIDSAPMPPARTRQLQALLPDTEIFVYYGLTEASRSTLISLTGEGPDHFASVGKPADGVEVAIAPSSGEVLIRGSHLACGYWQDEALTAEVFADGWLHTGDIGCFDERGFLFLTGRLKDQINVGGQKVDPSELEVLIRQFPGIADVGVCGLQNAGGLESEAVACAIVPAKPGGLDEQALVDHCARNTEAYKIPSYWFEVAHIPRAETGKLLRADLRAMLNACLTEEKN